MRISGLSESKESNGSHPHPESDPNIRVPGYPDPDWEIRILYYECIFDIKIKKSPLKYVII